MWPSLISAFRRREISARALGDGQRSAGGSKIFTAPSFIPDDEVKTRGTTILDLQAEDPRDPGVVSVDFDVQFLGPIVGGAAAGNVTASFDWGTGKARHDALVQLNHGTRVSLRCSTLRVNIAYNATATMPSVRVSASAAYGQAVGGNPTFTVPLSLGAGLSSGGAIPKYAKSVAVYSSVAGAPLVTSLTTDSAGALVIVSSNVVERDIDLPGGNLVPRFIHVLNPTAGAVLCSAIFKLTLD